MKNHAAQESGTALIVVMLLMLVLTIMLIGFYFVTGGEQKVAASNRDNEVTYYGAVAGLEQMSNAIADYFAYNASATPTGITTWATNSSNFTNVPYYTNSEVTTSTSSIQCTYTLYCTAPCNPAPCTPVYVLCSTVSGNVLGSSSGTIGGNGALAGLQGIITPLMLTVVADGPNNTEVKLNRTVQEVAVPIFEFGIFSDSDLSFFAGPTFYFGGRTHTNGNLFLAQDSGNTLLLNDYVTAAKSIIRDQLENGYTMATYPDTSCTPSGTYCAYVNGLTTANGCPNQSSSTGLLTTGSCITLQINQGSVENGPGSTENPNWQTLSTTTYNGFIQDGTTGAKVLNLAIALPGINAQPISMIQRPPAGESTTSALGMARFFNQASLRILLSDTASAITSLPGIDTTVQPYPLAEVGSTSGYPTGSGNYTIQRTNSAGNYYLPPGDGCHPPLAESVGSSTDSDYMTAAGTTLLGGYIKIEMQCMATAGCPGTWKDVTEEILAQGISRDVGPGTAIPAATLTLASNGSLTVNTTYYYTVTAVNAYGETVGTRTSGVTTTSSNKTIKVTWQAVTGATGYNVYRTTTSGTYTGTGNGVINLVVGTAQGTSWVSPYSPTATFTDSGAITPTSSASGPPPSSCTNNSIIHLEEAAPSASLTASTWSALTPTNFVPINMYDPREGEVRDTAGVSTSSLNGIMNLVEVDAGNLQQWFAGKIATSGQYAFNGPDALNNSGYILYTSDRRMNCSDTAYDLEGSCAGSETGLYGNEDIINPGNATGAPNSSLDTGEDVDGDGALDTNGAYARPIATPTTVTPTGTNQSGTWRTIIQGLANTTTANPTMVRITGTQAQKNSVVVFRRALRLVNGTLGNLPPLAAAQATTCSGGTAGGFTVVSENPIYVQGDYNASVTNGFNDVSGTCHVPAAVMGDAVTLLSNNWTPGAQQGPPYTSGDYSSFASPTWQSNQTGCALSPDQRCATTTYYRMAIMGGKAIPFTTFNGTTAQYTWFGTRKDVGTDGGAQNFIRYIEDWKTSGVSLNYLGSLTSFYTSRQGTGIFKCCNTVYNSPTRDFTFDTDFQSISKLPPGTPRFTDVNALSYYQSVLASQ